MAKSIALAFLLLWSAPSFAGETEAVVLLDAESSVDLSKKAQFRLGVSRDGDDYEKKSFAFGFTETPVWEKVRVRSNVAQSYVLAIDHIYIADLRLYVVDAAGKVVSAQASGLGRNVGEDEPESLGYAFRFRLEAEQDYTLFVRAKSQFPISLPTRIFSETEFQKTQSHYRAIVWFYIGVIGSLVIYNFFVLLATRDVAYLLYIGALLSLHLFSNLAQFGFFRHEITPDFAAFNVRYFYVTHFFSLFATTLFADHFLDLKRRLPRLRRVLFAFPGVAFVCMLAGLALAKPLVDMVNQANSTVWAFVILFAALKLARAGHRQARFFFAAWSFLLGFCVINFLRIDGILPATGLSNFAILFGGIAEGTLLALALADRLNTLRAIQTSSEKFEAIAKTTQMLAHDARKPFTTLAAILDSLDVAASPDELKLRIKNGAREVRRSLRSVNDLARDIMEFGADASLGAIEHDFRLQDVLVTALQETFRAPREKHVRLLYSWRHAHRVNCSAHKLARVFANILDNAEQATKEGGRLWIATTSLVERGRPFVQITIGNSHSHIAKLDLERIFHPFYTKGKASGTGLGLAVAKMVVEAHGGGITCRSEIGRGTEFIITLPAASLDQGAPGLALPIETAGFSVAKLMCAQAAEKRFVLVVDDNPFILEAWESKLGEDVARVFATPAAALAALQNDAELREYLACAVVDYHFEGSGGSGSNGGQLAVALRKLTSKPVFLASDVDLPLAERRLFDRVIGKCPVAVAELLRA